MTLNWLDYNDLYEIFLQDENYHKKKSARETVLRLKTNFPYPEHWLNAPVEEKIRSNKAMFGFSELNYIICWMWLNKLYNNQRYTQILTEYFLHSKNKGLESPVWFARKINLLSKEEEKMILSIRAAYPCFRKLLAIHCILLGKTFKNFTDEDVTKIPELFNKSKYTAKMIQDVRIHLNYTNTIITRKGKPSKWDNLITHPQLGYIFKQYKEFLHRCDARKKYITSTQGVLHKLLKYLQNKNWQNFLAFDALEFKHFTEHLIEETSEPTAAQYISIIKRFFQWGLGESSYFPNELDFPYMYWTELGRSVKKSRKNSDGRAFSEPELADDIIKIIYDYVAKNDTEHLCRAFWLVIGSCPARFSYILYLNADNAIQPLPNAPNAYGIYSELADKAGNKYGQFPILDSMGVGIIKSLQERAKHLDLKPIINPYNNKKYIHLFQLTNHPWILNPSMIRTFFDEIVKPKLLEIYPDFENIQASAHGFRHHLLTHVALKTGDVDAVQTAAGHSTNKMTREYLRSKISKTALLHRVMDKFESKEITGKFYLRLVELLSSEETPIDEMLRALTTEMKIDEFIQRFGKKTYMGYCFKKEGCTNWLKCWGCTNFLMTKEEITQAVKTLAHQTVNLKDMQKNCADFTYEHPIIHKQVKTIALIVKRLTELNLTEEQITKMVDNYLHDKNIEEGVIHNEC